MMFVIQMGHSKEDKAKSHDRIVEIAAQRIRESGADGPGVAEIMQAAGLTHGGFYKHFSSRDQLVAEAAEQAFAQGRDGTAEVIAGAADPLAAFVDWYVSADHAEHPGSGCAVVALGADAARSSERLRAAYDTQVGHYLSTLERLLGDRQKAVVALTTLVGSVLVARAVGSEPLRDEILATVRAHLKTV